MGFQESGSDGRRVSPLGEFICFLPRRLDFSSRVKKFSFVSSLSFVTQGAGSGFLGKLKKSLR